MEQQNFSDRFYQNRVKFNLFGSIALGIAVPIATLRYGFLPRFESGNLLYDSVGNSLSWITAAGMSVPYQFITLPFGICLGASSCMQLHENKRIKLRESQLDCSAFRTL